MLIATIAILAAVALAYGNGANDNYKGVATLYGSGTTDYRGALIWATITTFTGSVVSLFAANQLIVAFSGKGLVSDTLAGSTLFATSVGIGAAVTIFLATRLGMPTSTTHSLIGGLLGAGIAARTEIGTDVLMTKFAIPILSSPILAILLASLLYMACRTCRQKMGITKETCICMADGSLQPVRLQHDGTLLMSSNGLEIVVDDTAACQERYQGRLVGVKVQSLVDVLHYLSGGAVCFSRAVNDTPKIAALLLTTAFLPTTLGIAIIGIAMALGGIRHSRRVAETISHKITDLNTGQGFTANITTAILVLFASNLGVPVSTTHVSCGAIFGIGMTSRSSHWNTISAILTTWVTTLPLAALVSGLTYMAIG